MAPEGTEKKGGGDAAQDAPQPASAAAPKETPADRLKEVTEQVSRWSARLGGVKRHCLAVGRPLVVVGLLLVILARGCDAVGRRGVAGARMRSRIAQSDFKDAWDRKEEAIQKDIRELGAIAEPTDDQKARLETRRKDLEKVRADRQKEESDLQAGRWRDLDIAARDADAWQQIKGASRERWFVFGTLLLVFGLLSVAMSGQGAERWVALVILSIVILSFYNAVIALGRM